MAHINKIREIDDAYLAERSIGVGYKYNFNIVDGIRIIRKAGWHR